MVSLRADSIDKPVTNAIRFQHRYLWECRLDRELENIGRRPPWWRVYARQRYNEQYEAVMRMDERVRTVIDADTYTTRQLLGAMDLL